MSKGVIAFWLLTAISACWIPVPARAVTLRCDIATKQLCTAEGCKNVPAETWNFIDLEKQTFSRCDKVGCDTYPANFSGPTEYLIVEVPGRGVLAKLGRTNGDFMEVATLMTTAILSFGTCKSRR
jgi:hypothetical protein